MDGASSNYTRDTDVLTFSDERAIARYEQRVKTSPVVGTVPFDSRADTEERRIR
jgi:hypothetical protein